jgi:hypothetical protein
MEASPSPFPEKLGATLRYAEIGFLIVSAIGLMLFYANLPKGLEVIMIGLSALSTNYFLYAFTIPPKPEADSSTSPNGFIDLLPTIVRKVVYLGCSVALIGLLYVHLKLPGGGDMLLIGGSTLVISCLLSGFLILRNNASISLLQGPLLRGLPILVLAGYWMATHVH